MMTTHKKILTLAIVSLLSSGAFADAVNPTISTATHNTATANTADVKQTGSYNDSDNEQSGGGLNELVVVQDGIDNDSNITQNGSNNFAYTSQNEVGENQVGANNLNRDVETDPTTNNWSDITQSGHYNIATLGMIDDGNNSGTSGAIFYGQASDNSSSIAQTGNSNEAHVNQLTSFNISDIDQIGGNNTASVIQSGGNFNLSDIDQSQTDTDTNEATVIHAGASNSSTIVQDGSDNTASTTVADGSNNSARIDQTGSSNTASIALSLADSGTITSNDNTAAISQTGGDGNQATITIVDNNNEANVTQTGNLNEVALSQSGNEIAAITQTGDSHKATVEQVGYSTATVTQIGGNNNTVAINQTAGLSALPINRSIVTVEQTGNYLEADIAQLNTGIRDNITITQTGDYSYSKVEQNGGKHTATVIQEVTSADAATKNSVDILQSSSNMIATASQLTLGSDPSFGNSIIIEQITRGGSESTVMQIGSMNRTDIYQH